MLCYRSEKEFRGIHFIVPALIFVALFIVKIVFADFGEIYGSNTLFGIAFVFGGVYSILPFVAMYKFQINLIRTTGTLVERNNKRAVPFIFAIVLFPVVFTILPFWTGHNPEVFLSIVLMLFIVTALVFNIPLIYEMILHYTSHANINFLLVSERVTEHVLPSTTMPEVVISPLIEVLKTKITKLVSKKKDATSRAKPKTRSTKKDIKKIPIKYFNKSALESYMHKHKPYLEIDCSILVLVKILGVNRTFLSGFINRTYATNFNTWINSYRLKELDRLLSLTKNEGMTTKDLFAKAGFASHRNCVRAIEYAEALGLRSDSIWHGILHLANLWIFAS